MKMGKLLSCRAITNACAKNPNQMPIQCYAVIRSDGTIGAISEKQLQKEKKSYWPKNKQILNFEYVFKS